MKKKLLLMLAVLCLTASYGQKSKKKTTKAKATTSKVTTLAKAENVTAGLIGDKANTRFYLLVANKGKTDSLLVKMIVNSADKAAPSLPEACKITPFTAKGQKFYSVSWTEKATEGDPRNKVVQTTDIHTQIWDLSNKDPLFTNIQTTRNITEILWLDKNKTASQTKDSIRREGFEFVLNPDGTIIQKNKTQQNKFAYDPAEKKFVGTK